MALSLIQNCAPSTFSPSVFGAEILSVEANVVTNYSASVPEAYRYVAPDISLNNASFCNVTVSYTHPGQNDNINVEAWLPLTWNGRFQAVGGSGWSAGRIFLSYANMAGALSDGFATTTTDAGLGAGDDASLWALNSPGNVNLYNLQNLASVSLNDEAIIGKSLIKSFYGRGPEYSYWNGCSQGGRQGLMLAQRYPTAYDGISAAAPAIYFGELAAYAQYPQQIMNEFRDYPHACEFDAITSAAISACDGLDGVVDGVISSVDACLEIFDPFSTVGKATNCSQANGASFVISEVAATVANATWHGRKSTSDGGIYHGIGPGADLTGNAPSPYGGIGLAMTNCTGDSCSGLPFIVGTQWLQLFGSKDETFDMLNLTRAQFDALAYQTNQQYSSIMNTVDPDITAFQNAGGKMVTFHGLADNIIPSKSTERYYNSVMELIPNTQEFYRYFEVPGLSHCFGGGKSGQPNQLFDQLRNWVENGTAPDYTFAKLNSSDGSVQDRILCPYPQKAVFDANCADAASAKCWSCQSVE